MKTPEELVNFLHQLRVSLSDEKRTQDDIAKCLMGAGVDFKREHRLGPGDIIDFFISGIGIEVKLKKSRKMLTYRQLTRYAKHPDITSLILVSNLSMGLPKEIEGKPVWAVSLGRVWL